MKKGKKPPPGVSKATALISSRRVGEFVRIRLDGAEWWDVAEYYSEKSKEPDSPWFVKPGGKPLDERQVRAYVRKADAVIIASSNGKRGKIIRRHLAQRRNLYAKAVNAGDLNTALAVLRDEAALRGLYPEKKIAHKHGGDPDNPTSIQFSQLIIIGRGTDAALAPALAEHATLVHANGDTHNG